MRAEVGASLDHVGRNEVAEILTPDVLKLGTGLGRVLDKSLVDHLRARKDS
jgi:hypothetical protein